MTPKRIELHKQLPLKTPMSVHIFPSYKCNFSCSYCIHAMSTEELKLKEFKKENMSFNTYKNAIDGISKYDEKLKALIFAGHGEPLIHPDIAKMVQYAKERNISERIEITTNASLLTKKMSDDLIKAGVDRLKISIQGTNKEKYLDIAKYKIDYEKFLTNLSYFYKNKIDTHMYIKIVDIALKDEEDAKKFKKMFGSICDHVDIEYVIPFVTDLDHSQIKEEFNHCKQGHKKHSNICSMPFYMQVIAPNGNILPCCSVDIPIVLGNVNISSVKDIWESKKQNAFLTMMLKNKNSNPTCKSCSVPKYGLQEGDYLDNERKSLLKKYEKAKIES